MSQSSVEYYDRQSGSFLPFAAEHLTWDDILPGPFHVSSEPDGNVFLDAAIYDIPRTTIAALKHLNRHHPGAYASVYNAPRHLQEVAEADTGVNMIVFTIIPPMEAEDRQAWKDNTIRRSLAAGCVGALVDFIPAALAEEFPDSLFLRRTQDV